MSKINGYFNGYYGTTMVVPSLGGQKNSCTSTKSRAQRTRYRATLISDDELDDQIDDTNFLTEQKIIPNTYDYTDLCFGVLFEILLSLLFDLTQQTIANGY